jgi:holo-[acyl-carrier protein] synthase
LASFLLLLGKNDDKTHLTCSIQIYDKTHPHTLLKGLGTDIVEVERIASKLKKNKGFKELVFSPAEIAYCESQGKKYEHYAARFAAKEAFLKAIGTGWAGSGTNFNEIEIRNDENGKPQLFLLGKSKDASQNLKDITILVSLSHIKTHAIATVVIF